jgi:hypothetical protein
MMMKAARMPERKRDGRHERRAQVKQKDQADQRHDDEIFDELLRQIVDGPMDQAGSIVNGNDFDPFRQARSQGLQLRLYCGDRLQRILAGAHDDDAACHLALAVEFGKAAPHLGSDLDSRHVGKAHRNSRVGGRERNLAKILDRRQVARRAHHVFGFAQFQH